MHTHTHVYTNLLFALCAFQFRIELICYLENCQRRILIFIEVNEFMVFIFMPHPLCLYAFHA